MLRYAILGLSFAALPLDVAAEGTRSLVLVLDASGSMKSDRSPQPWCSTSIRTSGMER